MEARYFYIEYLPFLNHFPPYFLSQCLSLDLEFTHLSQQAVWQTPGICLPQYPQHWCYRLWCHDIYHVGAENSKPGPHSCMANPCGLSHHLRPLPLRELCSAVYTHENPSGNFRNAWSSSPYLQLLKLLLNTTKHLDNFHNQDQLPLLCSMSVCNFLKYPVDQEEERLVLLISPQ